MYHLVLLIIALVSSSYVVGRVHGRRALQRQLRGDAS